MHAIQEPIAQNNLIVLLQTHETRSEIATRKPNKF